MKQIYAGYIVKLQAATMRLFDALDDDYPNWRAIRANERAIQKWLDKITDDADEQRQILDIVECGNWNMKDTTFKPIFDELRALGYEIVEGQQMAMHIDYAERLINKLKAENAELRARLEKAVELPVKVGDTIYCIRNWGKGRYKVEEHTVIEIVFEYNNQMRIKTSCGLFGCEKWTFGLDCFADNAKAEARLKELQGGER